MRGSGIEQRVLLGDQPQPGRDVLPRLVPKTGQTYGGEYRYARRPARTAACSSRSSSTTATSQETASQSATPAARSYRPRRQHQPGACRAGSADRRRELLHEHPQQTLPAEPVDLSQRSRSFDRRDLSGTLGRYRLGATAAAAATICYGATAINGSGRVPQVDLATADRPIGRSRVYFGASGEMAYLIARSDDIDVPDANHGLWRFDAPPDPRAAQPLPFLRSPRRRRGACTRLDGEPGRANRRARCRRPINRQLLRLPARRRRAGFSRGSDSRRTATPSGSST